MNRSSNLKNSDKNDQKFDQVLYDKLNIYRNNFFKRDCYYSNSALKAFTIHKPLTKKEFLSIDSDVEKYNRFGEDFIRIIRDHINLKDKSHSILVDEITVTFMRIQEFEERLYEIIQNILRKQYKDDWWYDGIPLEIRRKAAELNEISGGIVSKEYCLHLINLKEIIMSSWSLFATLIDKENKGKKEFDQWFNRLNNIRNKVSHRLRLMSDPLKDGDVEFIKERSAWIELIFKETMKDGIAGDLQKNE